MRRFVPLVMAAVLAVGNSAPGHAQANRAEDIAALRKQADRVTAIGERLSAAAARAGWCEGSHSLGWSLGDLGQYFKVMRITVRNEWDIPAGASLFVASVAPGGAAARAGITPGMGIVSIAGRRPMRAPTDFATRVTLENSERIIDEALEEGPLQFETLAADGTRRSWTLSGLPSCATRFEVAADDDEQAYADGDLVQVTAGMGEFTEGNDAELAAVIAHELAHNMLRHIDRSREAGTPNNYQRFLGRYARISRKMEEEADRLSVWLLAIAGYEPRTPVGFWQRFGPGHDSAHPLGRLHDRWQDRVTAIEAELALMAAEKRRNPRARPALLDLRDVIPGQPTTTTATPAATPATNPAIRAATPAATPGAGTISSPPVSRPH